MGVTTCADNLLRVWVLKHTAENTSESQNSMQSAEQNADNYNIAFYYGEIERTSRKRGTRVRYNSTGTLIAVSSTSKLFDIYRIRDKDEVVSKMKRRLKRLREKKRKKITSSKKGSKMKPQVSDDISNPTDEKESKMKPQVSDDISNPADEKKSKMEPQVSDEFEALFVPSFRAKSKIAAFCW